MKRKITLSMMLILSFVLITMMSSDTFAQRSRVFVADTGVITLGPNQSAILSVSAGDVNGGGIHNFVTQKMTYSQGVCNDQGVCRLTLDNIQTSNFSLNAGEAIQLKTGAAGTRFRVLSRRDNLKVTLSTVDDLTGSVNSFLDVFVVLEFDTTL